MIDKDEVLRLERNLALALDKVRKAGGKGAAGAENEYGQAYQALVKIGARHQLRYKYRCPKR